MIYWGLSDEELAKMKAEHALAIHTQEFPRRCGMCRLFARLFVSEQIARWYSSEHPDDPYAKFWKASVDASKSYEIAQKKESAGGKTQRGKARSRRGSGHR